MFENPAKLIVLGILIGFLLLIVGILAAALYLRRKRRNRP